MGGSEGHKVVQTDGGPRAVGGSVSTAFRGPWEGPYRQGSKGHRLGVGIHIDRGPRVEGGLYKKRSESRGAGGGPYTQGSEGHWQEDGHPYRPGYERRGRCSRPTFTPNWVFSARALRTPSFLLVIISGSCACAICLPFEGDHKFLGSTALPTLLSCSHAQRTLTSGRH